MMKNTIPKIIVVLAAILFWLLVVSGQRTVSVVDLPLQVYEPRQEKALARPLPEKIRLRVEGPGRTIYFMKFQKKNSLVLDVGNISNNERISLKSYFEGRPKQVHLDPELKFLEVVYPDSIDIVIEDRVTRSIPVRVAADISVKPGHIQIGTAVAETVSAEGPLTILNKITHVQTQTLKRENVDLSFDAELALINPAPDLLKISPELVTVRVEIETIGERTIHGIPVQIRNQPPELQIKAIPHTVSLHITGGNTRIQKLTATDFTVYFDYLTQWLPNKHYYAPRVIEAADVLDVTGISPERIEIVVSRKNQP
ncbi:MAG: hypothetical protein PHP63_04005 [Candidatus Marinimicrobia bacterium]|nr:hypothetical protein [Candidatus Neomarinimicrobiota bacterium]